MPAPWPGTQQPREAQPRLAGEVMPCPAWAQTQGRNGRCSRVGREQHTSVPPKTTSSQGCPAEHSKAKVFHKYKVLDPSDSPSPKRLPQRCRSCPPSQSVTDVPSSESSAGARSDHPDTSSLSPARISGANPHPQPGEEQQNPKLGLGKPHTGDVPGAAFPLHKTTSPRAEAANQHVAFAEGRERALKGLCWKKLLLKKC